MLLYLSVKGLWLPDFDFDFWLVYFIVWKNEAYDNLIWLKNSVEISFKNYSYRVLMNSHKLKGGKLLTSS